MNRFALLYRNSHNGEWLYVSKNIILQYSAIKDNIDPSIVNNFNLCLDTAIELYKYMILHRRNEIAFIKIVKVVPQSLIEVEVLPYYWRNFNET